jgi:hypothetical protein
MGGLAHADWPSLSCHSLSAAATRRAHVTAPTGLMARPAS